MKKSSKNNKKRALVLVWLAALVVMALALVGPAPGYVGSCLEDSVTADPVEFCQEKNSWVCEREWAAGRLNDVERESCFFNINCSSSTWPPNCRPPSEALTTICIDALSNPGRLSEPSDSIVECLPSTLCPPISGLTEALSEQDSTSDGTGDPQALPESSIEEEL